jgi:hypothetical protein
MISSTDAEPPTRTRTAPADDQPASIRALASGPDVPNETAETTARTSPADDEARTAVLSPRLR